LSEQLVGRRQELAAIDAFLAADTDGAAALVLEGEAGIGKTSVWRDGVERARGRGFRVLTARPVGAEVRLSFAGLGDLLGEVVDEALPSLPEPQRHALEAALLLAESPDSPDPRAVGVAFVAVLRTLSRRHAVLVAVDDLQWLDRPSGQLLAFALRRLEGEPVRLLAAVRAEPGVGVPFELDRALGEARLQRLALGPLSLGALYELVRTRLDLTLQRAALVRLHQTSAGNPFFALEIGRELVRRGLAPTPEEPLPIPSDLRALLRRRLARLPEPTRTVMLAAAVLPRPTVSLLEAAIAPPEEVAAKLEQALQAGVIDLEGEEVRFSHPLLASVCYSEASPVRRGRMHARLARVDGDPEARAAHLAIAANGPDERVARALDEAARQASARGAPQAAAELWETAARLTPARLGDDRRRYRITAAEALLHVGDLTGARALYEQLLDETPAGVQRGALLLGLAMTRDDDVGATLALCEQALVEAGGNDGLRSQAHRLLGLTRCVEGDIRGGLVHARRAVELAERAGEDEHLVLALSLAAELEIWTGEITPGLLDRALELERGSGSLPPNDSPRATLGRWLMYRDRFEKARAMLDAQLEQAVVSGDDHSRGGLLMHLTELECRAGDWRRADELAAECFELYGRRGLELQGGVALYARALVDAHLGRVEECRAAAARGIEIARDSGDQIFEMQNLGVLGFLDLSLGDFEAAARRLRDLPAQLVALGWNEPTVYPVWPNAIEALIHVGELSQAREYLEQYDERARASGSPWALATAARCRGLVAAANGELEAAREAFRRALAEHERTGPFERGRTMLALGAFERRSKQKRAARDALEAALAIFDELGAGLWAERVRGELARIGGRAPAGDELTPAERRVAELVAEGRTNREAASLLVLSEHTVDSHLRRVYRKLGVRSRAELAHHFAEHAQNRTGRSR
jgi:DNA-binding CsgD family transcriptional regulator